MGALRPVYVELFVLRGSVEESILARRAEWTSQAASSVADGIDEEEKWVLAASIPAVLLFSKDILLKINRD